MTLKHKIYRQTLCQYLDRIKIINSKILLSQICRNMFSSSFCFLFFYCFNSGTCATLFLAVFSLRAIDVYRHTNHIVTEIGTLNKYMPTRFHANNISSSTEKKQPPAGYNNPHPISCVLCKFQTFWCDEIFVNIFNQIKIIIFLLIF